MGFERYESRFQAGEILTELIKKQNESLFDSILQNPGNYFCFAIPNGGVPVAEGWCSKFNIEYDLLIVRKIKIPFNTEAGFGSITTDGTVLINDELLSHLNLTEREVNDSIELTKSEIRDRLKFYNKQSNLEEIYKKNIQNKGIFMLDDGLASGFTMLAAIKMVKKYYPEKIFVAVPTSPLSSVRRVKPYIDELFCPNIRNVWHFAVADAYKHWYDVPESEILEIINNSKFYSKE
ncbi:MAG: phosphoribosyltransferase [Promethearchaeota archaeon]|nr:MAG: phosphoribosyltransferase [Candidatus Lokiarchaeota archaeon]